MLASRCTIFYLATILLYLRDEDVRSSGIDGEEEVKMGRFWGEEEGGGGLIMTCGYATTSHYLVETQLRVWYSISRGLSYRNLDHHHRTRESSRSGDEWGLMGS